MGLLDNRLLGILLILSSLAADVVLTSLGRTVPALVASVCTAGLGMVTVPVWRRKLATPGAPAPEDGG
jgi:hypothetical protein